VRAQAEREQKRAGEPGEQLCERHARIGPILVRPVGHVREILQLKLAADEQFSSTVTRIPGLLSDLPRLSRVP